MWTVVIAKDWQPCGAKLQPACLYSNPALRHRLRCRLVNKLDSLESQPLVLYPPARCMGCLICDYACDTLTIIPEASTVYDPNSMLAFKAHVEMHSHDAVLELHSKAY